MKGKTILKKIQKAQLKQLLLPLLFECLMVVLFFCLPILPAIQSIEIDERTPLSSYVNEDHLYVRATVHDLYYSGDDYYSNGILTGHYYYTLNDGYCRFYIIAPSSGKPAEPYIESLKINGRLEKISSSTEPVLKDLAALLSCEESTLTALCDPYAVNVAVYVPLPMMILCALVIFCTVFGAVLLLYSLFLFLFPRFTPTCRQLRAYGNVSDILADAERDMNKFAILRQGEMALTPKYLLDFTNASGFIIPLHDVLWVFPLQDMHYSLSERHEKMRYSLRIVTIVGNAYEIRDKQKDDLDTVMDLLTDRYPNFFYGYSEEHDRMVHYILAENAKEKKALKKKAKKK